MNNSSNITGEQEQDQDKGCKFAARCLDCPFEECIRAEVVDIKNWLKTRRDASIVELKRTSGMSISKLAKHFHVTQRTVYRAIEKNQKSKIKNQRYLEKNKKSKIKMEKSK